MPTPFLLREAERLRTLQLYQVLDTGAESVFDDLTRLAAAICDAPIALISLIDGNRQWFKANVGLSETETPREIAFCAHAIESDNLLVVPDALIDERFAGSPLVTGSPHIRFYAGAPLVMASGYRLGTLCVIDSTPKILTDFQANALGVLRQAVVTQLELNRSLSDLRAMESLLPICAWCRDVQDTDGSWRPLHDYVVSRENVTHGMCPGVQRPTAGSVMGASRNPICISVFP